ncbi:hypothetical protein MASR2M15_25520 [Anaerolineales bacterium]
MKRSLKPILFIFTILILSISGVIGQESTAEPMIMPPPLPEPSDVGAVQDTNAFQFGEATSILIDARSDLELLASNQLGIQRPEGWSGSLNVEDPQLPILIRLDLELLANALVGGNVRPTGWFGAVPGDVYYIARDIRHDLELLANTVNGEQRLPEWLGAPDPLMACSRSTQILARFLLTDALFVSDANPASPDYCTVLETQVSQYGENLLLNKAEGRSLFTRPEVASAPGTHTINWQFAVSYLDVGAGRNSGVMPYGQTFQPIARSYSTFSRMTLVQGDKFLVFIEWTASDMTEDDYDALPDVAQGSYQTFCEAKWCK